MKKFRVVVCCVVALAASVAMANGPRRRAVGAGRMSRVEIVAPAQIGISYGTNDNNILTVKADGTMFWMPYLQYALGNSMPPQVLDVSSATCELLVRTSSETKGLRLYSPKDALYPKAIMPFDPVNIQPPGDNFIRGTTVEKVVMDCPLEGVPNNAQVATIVAYVHVCHYLVVQPIYRIVDGQSIASGNSGEIGTEDGFPLLLIDHYQADDGSWWGKEDQFWHDPVTGKLVVDSDGRRVCFLTK